MCSILMQYPRRIQVKTKTCGPGLPESWLLAVVAAYYNPILVHHPDKEFPRGTERNCETWIAVMYLSG